MFQKWGPEEWGAIIGLFGLLLTFCGGVLAIAWQTMKYIIDIEKNTAGTSVASQTMQTSLNDFKSENERDHEHLHGRITGVEGKVNEQGEKLVEHSMSIKNLRGGSCSQ